jgi:hypothetical protein
MHFLSWSILVAALVFAVCLSLIKLAWELSQVSVHESPAFLETPGKSARLEEPPATATDSYESSPTRLGHMQ